MLVNISYSIDFEEVPDLLKSFLEEVEMKKSRYSNMANSSVTKLVNEKNFTECLKTIEDFRKFLAEIDMRLSDCSSILKGYTQYLIEPEKQESEEAPLTPDVSSLQENLAKLKETIGENGEN